MLSIEFLSRSLGTMRASNFKAMKVTFTFSGLDESKQCH